MTFLRWAPVLASLCAIGCGDVTSELISEPPVDAAAGDAVSTGGQGGGAPDAGSSGGSSPMRVCETSGDCRATAPVCNPTSGACGPCGDDLDCTSFDSVCDVSSGA
jgi:hypothetical protein